METAAPQTSLDGANPYAHPNSSARSHHRRGRGRGRGGFTDASEPGRPAREDLSWGTSNHAGEREAQARGRRGRGRRGAYRGREGPPHSASLTESADQRVPPILDGAQNHPTPPGTEGTSNPRRRHRPRPPRSDEAHTASEEQPVRAVATSDNVDVESGGRQEGRRPPRTNRRRGPANASLGSSQELHAQDPDAQQSTDASTGTTNSRTNANANPPKQQQQRSRRAFNSRLTDTKPTPAPADADLTTRLIHAFSNRSTSSSDALECPICFIAIHHAQPTWSCVLSADTGNACCWTTFHLKCIREWAAKSTKETRDAYRARNEDREGEWRCPGCQTKRNEVPRVYKCVYPNTKPWKYTLTPPWLCRCFCGRAVDPKPGRATPHRLAPPLPKI